MEETLVISSTVALDEEVAADPSLLATIDEKVPKTEVSITAQNNNDDDPPLVQLSVDAAAGEIAATDPMTAWIDSTASALDDIPLLQLMGQVESDAVPSTTDGGAGSSEDQPKKKERKKREQVPSNTDASRKRSRKPDLSEEDRVFHQSQKALRKEAHSLNIKNILHRSTSNVEPLESASPFSPLSPTASSTSFWSPTSVGDITSRFLATVERQKKQTFQRLISRELTQSQTSVGGNNNSMSACFEETITIEDELVIGTAEDDEDANWLPVENKSQGFLDVRRDSAEDDFAFSRLPSHVGGSSSDNHNNNNNSSTNNNGKSSTDHHASHHEETMTRTITRRHEIWRLQQRQLRAQQLVDQDDKVQQPPHSAASGQHAKKATTAPAASQSAAASNVSGSGASVQTDLSATLDALLPLGTHMSHNAKLPNGSIRGVNLSDTDLSLIRRLNSFDNTSTQRVVVFGASGAAQKENSNSMTR